MWWQLRFIPTFRSTTERRPRMLEQLPYDLNTISFAMMQNPDPVICKMYQHQHHFFGHILVGEISTCIPRTCAAICISKSNEEIPIETEVEVWKEHSAISKSMYCTYAFTYFNDFNADLYLLLIWLKSITELVQINFEHSFDINANDFKRHVWGKALAGRAGLNLPNDAHQSVALTLHLFMHVSLYIPMSFVLPWEWPTLWSEVRHKWIAKTINYSGSLSARAAAVGHTGWWLAKEVPPPSEDEIMNFCQKLSRQIFHYSHSVIYESSHVCCLIGFFVELREAAVIGSSI